MCVLSVHMYLCTCTWKHQIVEKGRLFRVVISDLGSVLETGVHTSVTILYLRLQRKHGLGRLIMSTMTFPGSDSKPVPKCNRSAACFKPVLAFFWRRLRPRTTSHLCQRRGLNAQWQFKQNETKNKTKKMGKDTNMGCTI